MVMALPFENETIFCSVELDQNLISISSNLLLHNLLQIDIEIIRKEEEDLSKNASLSTLDHKSFALNYYDCK